VNAGRLAGLIQIQGCKRRTRIREAVPLVAMPGCRE